MCDTSEQLTTPDAAGCMITCDINKPNVVTAANASSPTRQTADSRPTMSSSSSSSSSQSEQPERAKERRPAPQRKLSVFSYNGFPSLQLLELHKQRRASDCAQQPAPAGDPALLQRPEATPASPQPKTRRSGRSDTLGSTGSSRASSCDEPAIGAAAAAAAGGGGGGPAAPATSSSSSLDTVEDWPRKQTGARRPTELRPFESIRTKLKRNSTPNAKALVASHIDDLISQNEAIVDNWNLVNIRSYNLAPARRPAADQKGPPVAAGESPAASQQPARRQPPKRASTSSMPTGAELEFATAAAAQTISSFQAAQSRAPQLESAIQNLSLKRKEEQQQQQLLLLHHHHHQQQQQQQQQPSAHTFNLDFHQPQNLIWNQQQQQQQQRDEQILMTSLLMDRYRQSLAELELDKQAALLHHHHHHHHQQMIDPYRLLALQPACQQGEALALLASLSQPLKPAAASHLLAHQHHLEHGGELLTQSLDSAKPGYTCQACDISFWTKDLLNYHTMTQCAARAGQPSRPMAFNFGAHNNNNNNTNSSSSSGEAQVSKSVSPPRLQAVSEESVPAVWQTELQRERQWSILKSQLLSLESAAGAPAAAASLPFKKRKISEPNMKY